MSQLKVVALTVIVCSIGIALAESNRRAAVLTSTAVQPAETVSVQVAVRAPGRIAGMTEEIELQSQLVERISEVHVKQGDRVEAGTVLITLDQQTLLYERELAETMVQQRQSELDRLRNGARASEIATASMEFKAAMATLNGASATLDRATKLKSVSAISQQEFDDAQSNFSSLQALAEASRNRLKTLQDPARAEDLRIALSLLRAAKANELLAHERLDRTKIRAPVDGMILRINGQKGELAGLANSLPLITMCNSRQQRVIVEVDEFDALKVAIGQYCELDSDGTEGVLARGVVSEIEPRMQRKEVFGQWAGERNDTFSRRVWVDLEEGSQTLPIGLPVQVRIQTARLSP